MCKLLGDEATKVFVQEFCAYIERYEQNILTCVRQLRYSAQSQKSLDAVLFVNDLPIVTVELKDSLTGQIVDDATAQYKRDCDPSEKIFQFGRQTFIHFAADNYRAAVTTKLDGVKAVQTFSRLNRTCAGKIDIFILNFVNDEDAIRKDFLPFQ